MSIVMNKHILLLGFLFIGMLSFGQQKESDRLKKQQKQLTDKISFTENLLKSNADKKSNLTNTIGLINTKIKYRQELLNNINLQQKELNNDIISLKSEIVDLEQKLKVLILSYKNMIKLVYKYRDNSSSILFILSSSSFNQANKRMEYLDQITKFRADQIRRIKVTKQKLLESIELLNIKQQKQIELIKGKEKEKQNYLYDLQKQKTFISSINDKNQQLQDELDQQRKKAKAISRAIDKAINKEILAERERLKKIPKTVKETKEVKLNNSGFLSNKGRLPWPVSKGEVSRGYGKQPHAVHVGVYTYNNGVDILTVKGSSVRSVYNGTVSSVILIPGAGKAVIIAHGNYRTIYSNLQESYVKKGDKITSKQEIGSLLVNSDGTMSQVHFEIRQITTDGQIKNLNPSYWLFK
jgi:septal ring factor EnvC (AmiA/AmiB activator)